MQSRLAVDGEGSWRIDNASIMRIARHFSRRRAATKPPDEDSVCVVLAVVLLSTLWASPSLGQMDNFAHTILRSKGCVSSNFVLPRGDGINHDSPGSMAWSVNWNTYGEIHPHSIPYCTSIEELLSSLKGGVRVTHNTTLSDQDAENAAESWFVPQGCSFKWYTSNEVCQILGKFSQIFLVGDSFIRHIHHALFMLLRNDLQLGAMPLLLEDVTEYDMCQCDGQFSEHSLCRTGLKASTVMWDPRQFGICTGSSYQRFSLFRREPLTQNGYRLDWNASTCPELSRPIFILLGAGAHHKHVAHDTIHNVIEPFYSEVKNASSACPNVTFHVTFVGLGSQSRSLDHRYPHQSRERTASFNAEVSGYLKEGQGTDFFDVFNLTQNAPTSDGYHTLSDVNLIKAMYLLNYMDLLAI